MTSQTMSSGNHPDRLRDDFIAVVTGIADKATKQRVLATALTDTDFRMRLAFALAEESDDWAMETDTTTEAARTAALREKMAALTLQYAAKPQFDFAGTVQDLGASLSQVVTQVADLLLSVKQELLTLPCLSPALAAPGPLDFLTVQSQSVTTGEGVRIEFQQLPPVGWEMTTKPHLRVVVDASALEEPFGGENGYNTAFVTLEEGGLIDSAPTRPDLHTLVVPLNAQGLGFTDANAIPPPKAACRLVAVTLSHIAN